MTMRNAFTNSLNAEGHSTLANEELRFLVKHNIILACEWEFGAHDEHKDCAWMMAQMEDPTGGFDFTYYDIPAGTPDSWIPDNPDDNGMRMSDFI